MRKILLALCLVVVLSFSAMAEENRAYFPAILMYHDIKITPQNNFDVLIEDFRRQLDWLKENGYETLSIEDCISYITQEKDFPEKSVVITFDDGYNGIYNFAAPELKKRGMKATFFLTSDMIGVLTTTYPHVTAEEVNEMANDELFTIGSHTLSHSHLEQLTPEELKDELEQSKEVLEKLTGKKVLAVAYPYGDYNKEIIEAVKKAGYEIAFAVQDKGFFDEAARFSIPRINMGLDLSEDDLKLFKEYVQNYKNMPEEAFTERWQPLSDSEEGAEETESEPEGE